MAFIDILLKQPSYGWADANGALIVPTTRQLFREAFSRLNIFQNKKNWISLISWVMILFMVPFVIMFVLQYFTWTLLGVVILYATVIMGTHGTVWFHRYCTHRSYTFSHPVWRFLTQNLVIKTFPEEIYVISHHVHHVKSDEPGDPYNSKAGIMYCMLSDVNHQSIAKDLNENYYNKAAHFMKHSGV